MVKAALIHFQRTHLTHTCGFFCCQRLTIHPKWLLNFIEEKNLRRYKDISAPFFFVVAPRTRKNTSKRVSKYTRNQFDRALCILRHLFFDNNHRQTRPSPGKQDTIDDIVGTRMRKQAGFRGCVTFITLPPENQPHCYFFPPSSMFLFRHRLFAAMFGFLYKRLAVDLLSFLFLSIECDRPSAKAKCELRVLFSWNTRTRTRQCNVPSYQKCNAFYVIENLYTVRIFTQRSVPEARLVFRIPTLIKTRKCFRNVICIICLGNFQPSRVSRKMK